MKRLSSGVCDSKRFSIKNLTQTNAHKTNVISGPRRSFSHTHTTSNSYDRHEFLAAYFQSNSRHWIFPNYLRTRKINSWMLNGWTSNDKNDVELTLSFSNYTWNLFIYNLITGAKKNWIMVKLLLWTSTCGYYLHIWNEFVITCSQIIVIKNVLREPWTFVWFFGSIIIPD